MDATQILVSITLAITSWTCLSVIDLKMKVAVLQDQIDNLENDSDV